MSDADVASDKPAPESKDDSGAKADTPVGLVGEWRSSWLNFPKSLMFIVLAPAIAFAICYFFVAEEESKIIDSLVWAAVGIGGLSLPIYIGVNLVRKTTSLSLFTDGRLRSRTGVIARKTSEILAKDIRSIDVTQTTLERILGIGKIEISTASRDDVEVVLNRVRGPEGIRQQINRFRDDNPHNDTAD